MNDKKIMINLRSIIFWGHQFITRGEILKSFQSIKKFDSIDSDSYSYIKYKDLSINRLLQHAINTTDFYSGFQNNLLSFPVIDKISIKENYKKLISNIYSGKSLIPMTTSGSTGTPFTVFQNPDKRNRVIAEVIYYSEKSGYKVGRTFIHLRALTNKLSKSRIKLWMQNEVLIDSSNLDIENIKKTIALIKKYSLKSHCTVLAYASTLKNIRDFLKNNNDSNLKKTNITGIISSSEILYDDIRKAISEAFDCDVYSRYANQENGILGQDLPKIPNNFLLNEASYYFEILDFNSNERVADGEVGRIVITDLYNYAMPMIRYDTGDVGAIKYIRVNGIKKKVITSFSGRKVDTIFDCNGNRLSPHTITNNLWDFDEIKQFQFVQVDKTKYVMRLNVIEGFKDEKKLKSLLVKKLGNNAIIDFEYLDEIPILNSGKRRMIVNEYIKL